MRIKYPIPAPPHIEEVSVSDMGIQVILFSMGCRKKQMDVPLTGRHKVIAKAIKAEVRVKEPTINTMELVQVDQKVLHYQYSFRNKA